MRAWSVKQGRFVASGEGSGTAVTMLRFDARLRSFGRPYALWKSAAPGRACTVNEDSVRFLNTPENGDCGPPNALTAEVPYT
jgi:hypothetical protein